MVSYEPLFKQIYEKNISKKKLRTEVGFGTSTLTKMTKNEYVSMRVIEKICDYLDCPVEQVIEFVKDENISGIE